jgi:hypothetical protein
VAQVLPRRLAPVLPTTYSLSYLHLTKAHALHEHWEFPYRTYVHCKGFAPAAPRRARVSVSVPFSGLPLSRPVLIKGLVVLYTTNSLISRQLILWHCFCVMKHSSIHYVSGFSLSFPRLSQTKGQIIDVLLSIQPVPPKRPSDLHGLVELP